MNAVDGLGTPITYGDQIAFPLECTVIAIEPGKDDAELMLRPTVLFPVVEVDSASVFTAANSQLQNG